MTTKPQNHYKNWWSHSLRRVEFACLSFEARLVE